MVFKIAYFSKNRPAAEGFAPRLTKPPAAGAQSPDPCL